ncbi:LysR substrate-binding domain-containing protein [Limnobacter alexandrii]|uniref:LysR substrate-binding domain-containing protein n=1 Tax=Limnobacter alexandrii TaxID=2570352 RepID=UPI00248221EB|nr:LysR substrate-binding domain-containing protein [Limnobacter alexandrii]
MMAAAIRGQGIIYQPEFIVAEALANGELISLSLDHPPLEPGGLYVLFSPDRRLSLKVRAMIDYLVEVFSAEIQE